MFPCSAGILILRHQDAHHVEGHGLERQSWGGLERHRRGGTSHEAFILVIMLTLSLGTTSICEVVGVYIAEW